jgi:hypothetical protein
MPIDIDALTESELIDLNHRVVARLRFPRPPQCHFAEWKQRFWSAIALSADFARVTLGRSSTL